MTWEKEPMDKKTIRFLKNKYPKLFEVVARSPLLSKFATELDRARYVYCMLVKKPYFGTVALAGQTWEERKPYMRRIVQQEMQDKKNFSLLEIGSWVGNSAVLWADTIKSAGGQGLVVCVDPWQPYFKEDQEKVHSASIIMNKALKKDRVFKLFLHNIKASGHSDIIFPFKGSSSLILPLLEEKSFDMAYVDGDHSYSSLKKDLHNAARVVSEGGIIAGDDFDMTLDQIDKDYAQEHREVNCVIDPKTKQLYHPGVCLAVSEFFEMDVSRYCGFWAMRKAGAQWQKVRIDL
jgi:predicted O-methyltransferase YrrM